MAGPICPRCGEIYDTSRRFCWVCNYSFASPSPTQSSTPTPPPLQTGPDFSSYNSSLTPFFQSFLPGMAILLALVLLKSSGWFLLAGVPFFLLVYGAFWLIIKRPSSGWATFGIVALSFLASLALVPLLLFITCMGMLKGLS